MQPKNKKRIGVVLTLLLVLGFMYYKWVSSTYRHEGDFLEMVYYAGAVDIVLSRDNFETQYRVKSDDPIFGHVISLLSDPMADEGPPESNKNLVGQLMCVELNRQNVISRVWLSGSSEVGCE